MCTVILHMFHFSLSPNWNVSGIFMIALLQRHSLCNKKNTKRSFFVPKIPTDMEGELTYREVYRVFQAESGFFIKIID